MAESATLRAKAWRYAVSRDYNQPWTEEHLQEAEAEEVRRLEAEERLGRSGAHGTKDIHEFHERAALLLQDCGGRINSLTFGYKWEQHFGENVHAFARRERLSIAALLRQSNRFWVVDMPSVLDSATNSPEEMVSDGGLAESLQVYVLLEKSSSSSPSGRGQPLGDQLGMHGESDAIRQWRARRSSRTLSRLPDETASTLAALNATAQVVGGPALPTLPLAAAAVAAWDVTSGDNGAGAGDEGWAATAGTCAGPVGGWGAVEACGRVGAVMDMLDPVVSGVDGRMGLRQAHMALTRNCTCAAGAVAAMGHLQRLAGQAKGRQVRRLEDQLRALAEVVQAGISSLDGRQIATALGAVSGRGGYESLWKFAASRLMQPDALDPRRGSVDAAVLAQLLDAFTRPAPAD